MFRVAKKCGKTLQGGKLKESCKNTKIMAGKQETGMLSNQVSVNVVMSRLE